MKSPTALQIDTNPQIKTLEDAAKNIKELAEAFDEAYRYLRGDMMAAEKRLNDGGL